MRWIVAVVALAGCLPPAEADFPAAWAAVQCDRQRECDKGDYESRYEDMGDCREQNEDAADDIMDAWDLFGGDYDRDEAGECLSAMRTASCEEVNGGDFGGNCDNIYH